jgi:hypothetical protein
LEAFCVAPANGVIKHVFNVEEWDSRNELVAQGLVGLLVETVSLLVDKVLAVEFSDVGLCRSPWMVGLFCGVDRSLEPSAGDADVGCGGNGQGKVAMTSNAAMGMDGGSMGFELLLGSFEGSVVGLLGRGCNWGQRRFCGEGSDCVSRVGHGGCWLEMRGANVAVFDGAPSGKNHQLLTSKVIISCLAIFSCSK